MIRINKAMEGKLSEKSATIYWIFTTKVYYFNLGPVFMKVVDWAGVVAAYTVGRVSHLSI